MPFLILTLTILFSLIAWLRLPWAVMLVCALLPSYLLRTEFFGIPTTMLELMLLIVIIVWLVQNRHRLRELFAIRRSCAIAISLFVVAATISALIAPNIFSAFGIWKAYFIEPILFFYLIVDLHKQNQIKNDKLLMSTLIGGMVVAIVAIIQWLTGAGIPIPWDIERRVTGVFDYPNALGLYLGPLAVLAPIYQRRALVLSIPTPGVGRKIALSIFFLLILTIILAKSEAAIAAIILTLIVMGLTNPKFRKKTILTVAVLAIVSLAIPFSRSYLIQKFTLRDYSGEVRRGQWSETWELIKDHSILGVGLSGYPTALKPYHTQTHIEIFQYPHNIFLNIWVELGLIGLVAFGFLSFFVLRFSITQSLHNSITFFFPLITMFLHGLVDVPYFKNDLAVMTWIFIALLYVQITSPKIHR